MEVCKGLNSSAIKIHSLLSSKGFWDEKKEIGTLLMLVVSELSEALEAHRSNKFADIDKYSEILNKYSNIDFPVCLKHQFEKNIKDTFQDEISDCFIRLLDLCAAMGIDIEWHINKKLEYEQFRPYKHNKKY